MAENSIFTTSRSLKLVERQDNEMGMKLMREQDLDRSYLCSVPQCLHLFSRTSILQYKLDNTQSPNASVYELAITSVNDGADKPN